MHEYSSTSSSQFRYRCSPALADTAGPLQAALWSGHAALLAARAVVDAASFVWRSAVQSVANALRHILPQLWREAIAAAAAAAGPRAEVLLGQVLLWTLVAAFLFYLPSWLQVLLGA